MCVCGGGGGGGGDLKKRYISNIPIFDSLIYSLFEISDKEF